MAAACYLPQCGMRVLVRGTCRVPTKRATKIHTGAEAEAEAEAESQ